MANEERSVSSIQEKKIEKLNKLIPDSLPDEVKQALKSSVENLANEEVELQCLDEYVSKIESDDINISYYGLNRCRKILSHSNLRQSTEAIVEQLLHTNFLIKISDIAKNNSIPLLKYEALWIICNIGCGNKQQIQKILDNDGVNILFLALESEYDEIIELGVWALANISGDNVQYRDMLINRGIVPPLIKLAHIYKSGNAETFKTIIWAISNLARGKPTTKMYTKELLSILAETILIIEDEELLIDSCWGLSYLSDDEKHFKILIKIGVIEKLKLLLHSEKQSLVIPALRTIGNILTGNEEQTNCVLQTGVLQSFDMLLKKNKNNTVRREIFWSLSNIAAGTSSQVKQVIRMESLLRSIFQGLDGGLVEIQKEIAYILSNSVIYAEMEDLDYLINSHGLVQKLSSLLDINDKTIIQVSLEGFQEILKRMQNENNLQNYKQIIIDSNIIPKVENQQNHQSQGIYERSTQILELLVSEGFDFE